MNETIYIADDDKDILNLVKMFLVSENYKVVTFDNGDDLYDAFLKKPCDLAILDIMMPGTDGLSICNQLRKISSVPIILLTAKDSDTDYIEGITLGSDDYLTKPFRPTILTMRVKALLRRVQMERKTGEEEPIHFGDLAMNLKEHSIKCRGKDISFTSTEFSCMALLLQNAGKAVSKKELLSKVWGYDSEVETRVTDEVIRRIRKKLSQCKSTVAILTKWGFGFILVNSEENSL